MKIIAQNRKALYEYEILEKIEAGIALSGKEVRAIREGRANLAGSFAKVLSNELWLLNSHVGVVEGPERNRKLLVKKAELKRFMGKTQEKKLTLIPAAFNKMNQRIVRNNQKNRIVTITVIGINFQSTCTRS